MFKRFLRRLVGRCGGCGAKRKWLRFYQYQLGTWQWHKVCGSVSCDGHYGPCWHDVLKGK